MYSFGMIDFTIPTLIVQNDVSNISVSFKNMCHVNTARLCNQCTMYRDLVDLSLFMF